MKQILKVNLLRLLCFCVFSFPIISVGQPQEIKNAIDAISKITNGSTDFTSQLINQTGFIVPEHMQPNWEAFPAYRKIETAYWAAESIGNGEKFLAKLSSSLAQEYESVSYEKPLRKYLNIKVNSIKGLFPTKISFELPPNVPREIVSSIISIAKYTDNRTFGGTIGILKYEFGLTDDQVYKILRSSANDIDALLAGINKASIPPTKQERLKKIVFELRENFESANSDAMLDKIVDEPKLIRGKPGVVVQIEKIPQVKLKENYETFEKKTHPTLKSKNFSEMKVNAEGFGGVIFGNKVRKTQYVSIPEKIFWIHNKNNNFNSTGSLEFIFNDGSVKTIPEVLWEDAYAAYNIVYVDNENYFFDGNFGIGLTGATYPDVYDEDKVYDSIIRSNKLTVNENRYYNFRCETKRKNVLLNEKIKENDKPLKQKLDSLDKNAQEKIDQLAKAIYLLKKDWEKDIEKLSNIQISYIKNERLLYKQIELADKSKLKGDLKSYSTYIGTARNLYSQYLNDSILYKQTYNKYLQDSSKYANQSLISQKKYIDILLRDSIDRKKEISEFDKVFYSDSIAITDYNSSYKREDSLFIQKDSIARININRYLSNCNKIILYPVLANLELGRSLIRADVFPRSGALLVEKIKNKGASNREVELCREWLKGSDTIGWKFTDDSLQIDTEGDILKVTRQNNSNSVESQTGFLNFNKMDRDSLENSKSTDFEKFNEVVPILTKTFYDYYRLNNFAKTLAVFRWAKHNKAKFFNKPDVPPLYAAPAYCVVRKDGMIDLVDMK